MNPTSGSDILSYKGDAALGLNTEGLAQFGDTDTSLVNQAVQRASLLNLQKNKQLYQQKMQEKDETFKLIASGRLSIPQVRPENRQQLLDRVDSIKKILLDNRGDVQKDIETYTKFQDELTKFDEEKKYATSRLLELEKQQAEIAATQRPDLKRKYEQHYQQQVQKGLYEDITPFQQDLDYTAEDLWDNGLAQRRPTTGVADAQIDRQGNIDVTGGAPGTIRAATTPRAGAAGAVQSLAMSQFYNVTTGQPNANYERTTTGTFDYDKYLGYVEGNYLKDDGTGSFYRTTDAVNSILANDDGNIVNAANKAIEAHNVQRIKQGLPPITPLGVVRDQNGRVMVGQDGNIAATDSIPELKAKLNLIGFKPLTTSSAIDEDAAKVGRLKTQMESDRALAAQRRSGIPLNQAKTRYWNTKNSEADNSQKVENIFNNILSRTKNITVDHFDTGTKNKTRTEQKRVVLVADLPPGFAQVLGGVGSDGKPTTLTPKKLSDGVEYFDVAESNFITSPTGNQFSQAAIDEAFGNQSKYRTRQEFLRHLLRPTTSGGLGFTTQPELIGANGRGTSQATIQALRALNNKSVSSKTDEALTQENDTEE